MTFKTAYWSQCRDQEGSAWVTDIDQTNGACISDSYKTTLARNEKVGECVTKSYRLAERLSLLFDVKSKIETVLSVSMYYLNQFMDSERSSIFLFQHWDQQLTIFSSLDLRQHEARIPKSFGVAGWVFTNCEPVVVNNAYEDPRFCKEIDDMTGFTTHNMICAPLLLPHDQCLGTIQSLNTRVRDFTDDDLDLLMLAASMVAVAINNSRHYSDLLVANEARKKLIKQDR